MQDCIQEFIPLSVPNLAGNELKYVSEAVETSWVSTAGPFVNRFEDALASYVGSSRAVACQSGTAGIHVALQLAGVQPDDEVIVPALTFIASVNPVHYLGAEPIFMDCDDTLCMDPNKLEHFLQEECEVRAEGLFDQMTGRRIAALVVVHVFGNMADMPRITELCKVYGIPLIEDAAEALGTCYTEGVFAQRFAGTMADFGVYSFNGNKIVTTGGGGAIVTRDPDMLDHAKHLTTQAKSDPLYYEHDEVGYNYRMTNLQAALGLAQLEQLESFITVKHRNYQLYREAFNRGGRSMLLGFREGTRSNMWFYSLLTGSRDDRDRLIKALSERKIQTRPIWGLICDQLPYRDCRTYLLDKAPWYRDRVVNLPCSTNLSEEQVNRVVEEVSMLIGR